MTIRSQRPAAARRAHGTRGLTAYGTRGAPAYGTGGAPARPYPAEGGRRP
ncbi:hypothetical protein [Streptomyces sp. MAR4 CNX-425]